MKENIKPYKQENWETSQVVNLYHQKSRCKRKREIFEEVNE
jgi:hypothetical protein